MLLRAPIGLMTLHAIPLPTGAAVFSLSAYALVLWATHYVDVGVVSALRETSVLWAVIISQTFLGEAFRWRRVATALMICLGVMLLVAKSK
jgi:drug/metabolite transporter (DMT)-like permease